MTNGDMNPKNNNKQEPARDASKPSVQISVRRLVEFLLRSGDIDRSSIRIADKEAALAGGRLHRKLQREAGTAGDYESEVTMRETFSFPDLDLLIEGRADGVIDGNNPEKIPFIDEIKGMYLDVSLLTEPFPLHLAQAKCYAAVWAREKSAGRIGVQMTYGSLETEEIRRFRFEYDAGELRSWFVSLAGDYHRWASWQVAHAQARDASVRDLAFPFPYRAGQKKAAAMVYHTIREEDSLFLMAPTGVGKTMSCVFPAVKAVGEGNGERIFYLTAKNETLKAGKEAFSILRDRGLIFRTVLITSKEKICPMHEVSCSPETCPYAAGHFDRINEAVFDLLNSKDFYDRETLLAHSEKHRVCPFELTLDTASFCDAVLCDYNYVFDPDAQLKRFFAAGVKSNALFLIDEAHNLPERGRKMYSAELVKEHVLAAGRAVRGKDKKTEKAAAKVNKLLLAMRHETEDNPDGAALQIPYRLWQKEDLKTLLQAARILFEAIHDLYQENTDGSLKETLLDFFFELRTFLAAAEMPEDAFRIYTEKAEEGFRLVFFCVNPAPVLSSVISRGRAAVFFSATLLPVDYYKKLLTENGDAPAVYAESPFPAQNRLILTAADVSTRYAARSTETYRRIASYIAKMAAAKAGNYLAFFPSYRLMKDVFGVYRREYDSDDVNWVVQHPGMQEEDREIFLENFYENPEKSMVGFCVMGGMFSEGLDLTGTRLIGAAVVGAGIPQVSNEREILKACYDRDGRGFDYAYLYPGMNKVQQAAGRVIRTASDTGVILLLDDRFQTPAYRRLFPREWKDARPCVLGDVSGQLKAFWEGDRYSRE